MNTKRIEEALQVLYEEGVKAYKPEYQQDANRWESIGRAISSVESNGINFARIAYEALEDWNYHSACAVLDWIFPKLHPMIPVDPNCPADEYQDTLNRIKRMIDRQEVTVFTDWNTEETRYNTAKFRVEVVITPID